MLIVLIVWDADIDGNLSRSYRRCIDIWDDISGLNNQYFPIALIIDGIDTSTTTIVSMSMLQPITSMALSLVDDDTIDDASMADP
jgi:cephalosporin hydroxylase